MGEKRKYTSSLPTRVEDGLALPTLDDPQNDSLSSREYQSIAERCSCPEHPDSLRLTGTLQWRPVSFHAPIPREVAQRRRL